MKFYIYILILFQTSQFFSQSTFSFSGYTSGQTWTTNSYAFTNTQNGTTMTAKITQNAAPGWFNLTGATSPNYATYSPGSCGSITGLYLATDRSSTTPTVTLDMSFSPSVCGPVMFTVTDLNGADNSFRDDITITAYDQTGTAIALTTGMVSKNGASTCNGGNLGSNYIATSGNSLKVVGCSYDDCNADYFTISSATKMISRITIDYASGNKDWSGNTISNPSLQYLMISNIKAYTPVINITSSCASNPITLTGSIAGGGFPPTTQPASPYPNVVSLPTAPTNAWTGTAGTITSPTALATTVSGLTNAGGTYTLTVQNNKGCIASNVISVSSVNCTILPVELLYFGANRTAKGVILNWQTLSEKNSDYFVVERSVNGVDFEEVKKIKGGGNSVRLINYEAIDQNPDNQINYYRLKQVDYNGQYVYSDIVSVDADNTKAFISNIYPNPTNSNFDFEFYTPINGELTYEITDYTGRVLISKVNTVESGHSTLNTIMEELPNGIYFLKVYFNKKDFYSINKIFKN